MPSPFVHNWTFAEHGMQLPTMLTVNVLHHRDILFVAHAPGRLLPRDAYKSMYIHLLSGFYDEVLIVVVWG